MNIIIKQHTKNDIKQMIEIWNEIVDLGNAFPQIDKLTEADAIYFFSEQSFTGVLRK